MTYHLVSVPIAQASSPTSNLFLDSYLYYFDETQNSANNGWVNMGTSTTNPLTVTRGYMVYYQAGSSTTYSFTGPMNNGSFTATTSYTSTAAAGNQGFNLVPNPYPSIGELQVAGVEQILTVQFIYGIPVKAQKIMLLMSVVLV